MSTGERIRILRESQSMSQADLAKKLNLSRSSISMYEAGERIPSTYILNDMADLFNVDVDYLLGRTDKTTVLPERVQFENQTKIYSDENFTLLSPTRTLKQGADHLLGGQLLAMTDPATSKMPETVQETPDPYKEFGLTEEEMTPEMRRVLEVYYGTDSPSFSEPAIDFEVDEDGNPTRRYQLAWVDAKRAVSWNTGLNYHDLPTDKLFALYKELGGPLDDPSAD